MIPEAKLSRLVDRHAALEAQLASGTAGREYAKLSKEHAELVPLVQTVEAYRIARPQHDEADVLAADPAAEPELRHMADEERAGLKQRICKLERELQLQL